jgi:hypothetical protein
LVSTATTLCCRGFTESVWCVTLTVTTSAASVTPQTHPADTPAAAFILPSACLRVHCSLHDLLPAAAQRLHRHGGVCCSVCGGHMRPGLHIWQGQRPTLICGEQQLWCCLSVSPPVNPCCAVLWCAVVCMISARSRRVLIRADLLPLCPRCQWPSTRSCWVSW